MNSPVYAKVECTDGSGGVSTGVVVNPVTRQVTHLIVEDKTFPRPVERLVPVEKVAQTTADTIRLQCSQDELDAMDPFSQLHYIEGDPDQFVLPYSTPTDALYARIEEGAISLDELVIRRGMPVQATDGFIGKVGELLVDATSA